ncbi:MAG: flagellar hook-associated protein FlgK [Sporichthyaceae bacterium]
MSTFSGLSGALSGLQSARRGLDVSGQNISNANTTGYTRQRVELEAVGPPAVPALWSTYTGVGGGVRVTEVSRLADAFLTARAHTELGNQALLAGRSDTLTAIERNLPEPGETGLAASMSSMWSAWHDVTNRPGDLAARSALLSRTATLADGIRSIHGALDAQWSAGREQLVATVDAVNATAATVAELNAAIVRNTQAGLAVNELADQRDVLVTRLVQLTGGTARAAADGAVDVYLGGTALVRARDVMTLAVSGAPRMADFRAGLAPAVTVSWAATGDVPTLGGDLGSRIEALGTTIGSFADSLDAVVATLRDSVNTAHAAGYDLDGNPGALMFDPGATAADITALITDPRKVAAAAQAPVLGVPSLDGGNAAAMAELPNAIGSAEQVYRQLVVGLGAATQTAERRLAIQSTVASAAEAAREASAGVNIDEEMVSLLGFQRAYEASARVISTIDEALDVLINRMAR